MESNSDWTFSIYKMSGVDPVNVWYNELYIGCHPSYLETSDYLLWPAGAPWIPVAFLFIDDDNKELDVAYTNFYSTGGDEYYQVPLPRTSYTRVYVITVDNAGNTVKLVPRLWAYNGPLSNGHIIDITNELDYKGTHPTLFNIDENGRVLGVLAFGMFDWRSLFHFTSIYGMYEGIAYLGAAAFRYKTVKTEAKIQEQKIEYTYAQTQYMNAVNAVLDKILKFLDECPKKHSEEYCLQIMRQFAPVVTELQGYGAGAEKIKGADKDEDDISWKELLHEALNVAKFAIPLIGLMILMWKFRIFSMIFDMFKSMRA